ncbi:hypothetical protein HNP37_004478 [Flavobacterium nitrogenifigens]|uniref:Uncharacterized protein n=2 Tax=Flavobacterium TaxID=237 RepID=A0A7W7NAC2_9FLAO|nr:MULTISPECIES: hypothetical protein [Flavobacterium]MBB4804391.1 hypothetical protein [Flavobacterium nitrogenifigens]MBB6389213.1 hypothetical protein [Flavobacterium notoginsengisoli]
MADLVYEIKEHKTLHWLLQSNEFASSLVYLVCGRQYDNLYIISGLNSIEIFNDELKVVILFSVGYVNKNYLKIKDVRRVYYIVFSPLFKYESLLNDLNIIMISMKEWFYLISRSKNEDANRLRQLSNLKIKVIVEDLPG